VTFFTRIQEFSWKRIVGVNPLPRGASVGEFRRKPYTHENVGFVEVNEISFRVMCENSSQICLLRVNLLSISGRLKPAKLWNPKPAKIGNHEPAKVWNHEPVKIWNHELAKIWNHEPTKIWNKEPAKIWNHEPVKI
jgi:hypothetical protein